MLCCISKSIQVKPQCVFSAVYCGIYVCEVDYFIPNLKTQDYQAICWLSYFAIYCKRAYLSFYFYQQLLALVRWSVVTVINSPRSQYLSIQLGYYIDTQSQFKKRLVSLVPWSHFPQFSLNKQLSFRLSKRNIGFIMDSQQMVEPCCKPLGLINPLKSLKQTGY